MSPDICHPGAPPLSALLRLRVTTILLPCVLMLATPARAQSDPRLLDAVRAAQEGRGDSARAVVDRLLAATPPTDTLYPQIVYTQAMVANSAADMRRHLQRVAVEFNTSSWADDAMLRLVQMDYAVRNFEGAARNLERLRLDYPATPLIPQASYWAARTYFDMNNQARACRWLADGIAQVQGNVELQNQLEYLNQRCALAGQQDSGAAGQPDSARAGADSAPTVGARGGAPTGGQADTTTGAAAPGASGRTAFRIQVAAVKTASAAEATASRVERAGFSTVIIRESGYYKVRAGAFATREEAQAAAVRLKTKVGGRPFVVAEP
jgi:septal ring-binding cell division protein DamX